MLESPSLISAYFVIKYLISTNIFISNSPLANIMLIIVYNKYEEKNSKESLVISELYIAVSTCKGTYCYI